METVFNTNYFEKNALFIKFWTFFGLPSMENYVISNLPGIKEGISGSALIGYNIGIDSKVEGDKKEAAIKAVTIMTSREFQKSQVMKGLIISGMSSLYEDEEVCSNVVGCEIYNTIQPIAKPVDKVVNYIDYSEKFTTYFYDYLFGNKNNETIESVLKKIDDITRLYNVTIKSKETPVGLIMFILFLTTTAIMVSSVMVLFMKKFEKRFTFLPKLYWLLIITGIVMIASTSFVNYGELTDFKCQLKNNLFSFGYSFINIPILCQLIINIPETNKVSTWVNKHRMTVLLALILFDVLLNGLSLIKPHGVENIIIDEGLNFQICKTSNVFVIVMNTLIIVYKCIITLSMLLLVFIEWNFEKTFIEMRFVVSSVYINIITFSLYIVLMFVISNSYILYFVSQECIIYIMAISNYIILFGAKIVLPQLYEKNEMNEIIKKVRVSSTFKINTSTYTNTNDTTTTGTFKTKVSTVSSASSASRNSVYSRMLTLHYSTTMNEAMTDI